MYTRCRSATDARVFLSADRLGTRIGTMAQHPAKVDPQALVRYQRDQLKRFRSALERAASDGDVESIHDLRVASRRLHDVLAVIGCWVGRKRIAKADRALRRIRKAFRRCRDLDVLLAMLTPSEGAADANDALGRVELVLTAHRAKALGKAKAVAARARLFKDVGAIDDLGKAFEDAVAEEPELLAVRLSDMLRRRFEDLLGEDPQAEGADLHDARLRVKRMRYCLQLAGEAGCAADSANLMDELTRMQVLLGHWNDEVMAARTIGRLATRWRALSRRTVAARQLLAWAGTAADGASSDRVQAHSRWPVLVSAATEYMQTLTALEASPDADACPDPGDVSDGDKE